MLVCSDITNWRIKVTVGIINSEELANEKKKKAGKETVHGLGWSWQEVNRSR